MHFLCFLTVICILIELSWTQEEKLIKSYNYIVETHHVETEDGYILEIYRLPACSKSLNATKKYPVLVVHGWLGTSYNWLLTGPKRALAFKLADSGFDVWLLNCRGTQHSRKHKTLDPDDKTGKFWKFTWHEMGIYDIPTTIDYILNVTSSEKLHYVAHSQGTSIFFVMCSEKPQYNKKVKLFVALAPVAYFQYFKEPLTRTLAFCCYKIIRVKNGERLEKLKSDKIPYNSRENLRMFRRLPETQEIFHNVAPLPNMPTLPHKKYLENQHIYEFPPNTIMSANDLTKIARDFCGRGSLLPKTCFTIVNIFSIGISDQLESTIVPQIAEMGVGSGSLYQPCHFAQCMKTGRFMQYDWGPEENQRRYGSKIPRDYNMRNVKIPVILVYGESDWFSDEQDVFHIAKELPNVVEVHKIPHKKWAHSDFLWAKDANKHLNSYIIKVLRKFLN